MDNIIEIIKIVGAFVGPILGALALVLQRLSENRQSKVTVETSISSDAREWAEDFREEMDKLRTQSLQAQEDALKARLNGIEAQSAIHDLKIENRNLRVDMELLAKENGTLREEVITLRRENDSLRLTVEQQAKQIKELQNGNGYGKEHNV